MAWVQTCGGNVVQYNQRLSSDERLGLRGWSRPEVEGIGSEPLAKTGHSSQAETLGVSLNHKSNLLPSGFIGHPSCQLAFTWRWG
eukprot:scaffold19089_cov156-Skeletonema_dohrnii-CCMP3373.AAC.7